MKTRVVRHWQNTDWVYSVEVWEQVKESDLFVDCGFVGLGSDKYEIIPAPVVGSWRWSRYFVPCGIAPGIAWFSSERALSIASRLAQNLPQEDADVIAEFDFESKPQVDGGGA